MDFQNLVQQNPWWRHREALANDRHLTTYEAAGVKWRPELLDRLPLGKEALYTLRGPRQVGKTTLLKLKIRELLADPELDARAVCYCTCDLLRSGEELADLITQYLDYTSALPPGASRYLFLDEVSSVAGWEKGLKYLADTGQLTATSVVLTGSHALELKRAAERLPGRRGRTEGPANKLLLPLTFRDYVAAVAPELAAELNLRAGQSHPDRRAAFSSLFEGHIPPAVKHLQLFQRELKTLLADFLLSGGIIRAVNELARREAIEPATYEIYLHTLMGDLARWRYQEQLARQLIGALLGRVGSPLSLHRLARENEIGSHNTVARYLEALEDSFVLFNCHLLEQHRELPNYRRPRKVYFQDPFLYHALRAWTQGRSDYFDLAREALLEPHHRSRLVEMVVADHLARWAYRCQPSDFYRPANHLFYFQKKGTQKEVDFVLRLRGQRYPVEVKYQSRLNPADYANLRTFGRGLLVSEKTLQTHRNYLALPLELFLLFTG